MTPRKLTYQKPSKWLVCCTGIIELPKRSKHTANVGGISLVTVHCLPLILGLSHRRMLEQKQLEMLDLVDLQSLGDETWWLVHQPGFPWEWDVFFWNCKGVYFPNHQEILAEQNLCKSVFVLFWCAYLFLVACWICCYNLFGKLKWLIFYLLFYRRKFK